MVGVNLRDSVDELDALISELGGLRATLDRADGSARGEAALWEAEAGLRHVARRAESRARLLRRAIELHDERRPA